VAFGLPWKITDHSASKTEDINGNTEDIAVLLGNNYRHVIMWQDVTIPAGGQTDLDLHWRMSYQNEYAWADTPPADAFDPTNQYLALYIYDPSGSKGTAVWKTTTDNSFPTSVDSLQEYSVDVPDALWTAGFASTVRVEFEIMAGPVPDGWFLDVAVDDFMIVPDPPGAVTSGPIVMMAAQEFAFDSGPSQPYLIFVPLDQWANEATLSDATVMASSTVDPNSLKLLEVLETASQTTQAPLTTVTVLASATGGTETLGGSSTEPSGGEPAGATSQPVSPTSQPASTFTTSEPVTTTSEPTSVDTGTPTEPTSTGVDPAIAPEPILVPSAAMDVSYWLAAASDSVDASGGAPAVQDLTPDPGTALAFNLEDVSAWDVLKSSMANVVDPQVDPGLRNLASRLAAGEAFSVDLDSISLTRIFG
jgi:hypothetical protein